MQITEDTQSFPRNADPSDFEFLRRLITELEQVSTKEKVTFPGSNRNQVFAEIDVTLGYDVDHKPYAEFFFRSRAEELQMAHSAVVLSIIDNGVIKYHLQITPCRRLRSNGHKVIRSNHADARLTALAICRNYAPGTVGRKVIPFVEKKAA